MPDQKRKKISVMLGDTPVSIKKRRIRLNDKKISFVERVSSQRSLSSPGDPGLFIYTLNFIYKNLYILGVIIMRRFLRLFRRSKMLIRRQRGKLYFALENAGALAGRGWTSFTRRIAEPFSRISYVYREQRPFITAKRARGESTRDEYRAVADAVMRLVLTILKTVFNYAAPVAAAMFMISFIGSQLDVSLALEVKYLGEPIGYIRNEAEFEAAAQIVRGRLSTPDMENARIFKPATPKFTLVPMDRSKLLDSADLADILISAAADGDVVSAFGLYINNRFIGAVRESLPVSAKMEEIKASRATGKPKERIEFVKKVALTPAMYPADTLATEQEIIDRISGDEAIEKKYTVVEGDSPSLIATKMDVSIAELVKLNPGIEDSLKIGDTLLIAAAQPFLSVKNIYTDEYEEEYAFEVIEVKSDTFVKGYRKATQEGVNGVRHVVAEITEMNGIEVFRSVLDTRVVSAAVPEKVIVGVNDPKTIVSGSTGGSVSTDMTPSDGTSSSGFIWPTVSGTATTYKNHSGNGVDIAIGHGVPVYASASGTITKVVYSNVGYGNHIMINHGNGYETLYGHNSAIYVEVGQVVNQGDVIAAMGRTGRATGNHVHFEVRKNGVGMWPPDYIGYSG